MNMQTVKHIIAPHGLNPQFIRIVRYQPSGAANVGAGGTATAESVDARAGP